MQGVGDLVGVDPNEGRGYAIQRAVKRLVVNSLRVREAGADKRRRELPEWARLEYHPFPQKALGGASEENARQPTEIVNVSGNAR